MSKENKITHIRNNKNFQKSPRQTSADDDFNSLIESLDSIVRGNGSKSKKSLLYTLKNSRILKRIYQNFEIDESEEFEEFSEISEDFSENETVVPAADDAKEQTSDCSLKLLESTHDESTSDDVKEQTSDCSSELQENVPEEYASDGVKEQTSDCSLKLLESTHEESTSDDVKEQTSDCSSELLESTHEESASDDVKEQLNVSKAQQFLSAEIMSGNIEKLKSLITNQEYTKLLILFQGNLILSNWLLDQEPALFWELPDDVVEKIYR